MATKGHRSLECIDNENNTVYHLKDTLNLTAEVRMAWGVDDVDLYSFVEYSRILGEDSDSPLSLDVIGVHDTLFYFLVCAEYAALL